MNQALNENCMLYYFNSTDRCVRLITIGPLERQRREHDHSKFHTPNLPH